MVRCGQFAAACSARVRKFGCNSVGHRGHKNVFLQHQHSHGLSGFTDFVQDFEACSGSFPSAPIGSAEKIVIKHDACQHVLCLFMSMGTLEMFSGEAEDTSRDRSQICRDASNRAEVGLPTCEQYVRRCGQ